jgi:ribosomal protein S18 acetylase RimI-like enzyme
MIAVRAVNYRTIRGGLLEVMPHWIRGFSGLQLPFFNEFLPLDAAGLTDETLADTAAFFSSRNVYYVSPNTVELNLDLTIERVATVPSLTAFCTIVHAVFDLPLPDLVKLFPARHFEDDRIQHYLAFSDEQPVGAGTTVLTDGVASIWNICTLDSYRRRGVASTLLRRMLADVNEFGSDITLVYSTPHAYQLFSNFGFEIYTQRQWFLPPGIDYED